MTDRWWLVDVRERQQEAPYTFYKPSTEILSQLAVGDGVKLIFEFDSDDPQAPAAERMWVEITARDGHQFSGTLDNTPYHIKGLPLGTVIDFEDRHIANTSLGEDDGLKRYTPRCFVTKRVLHGGEPVGYLYREDPDTDEDSGWRIMVGDESDEYMEDSSNIAFVSLGAVLNRDGSFVHLIDAPIGSAFVRDRGGGGFIPEQA
jgi:hypothetical protein